MIRLLSSCAVAALAVVVLGTGVAPASAEEERSREDYIGNATGGGWAPGQSSSYTAREVQIDTAKRDMWESYADLADGTATAEAFLDAEVRVAELQGVDLRALREQQTAMPPTCGIDNPCPPKRKLLPVPHRSQVTNWHCGAAAGVMIAAFRGKKRSAHNGARLSQWTMGGDAHMKTNRNQVTAYHTGLFTRGLNRWLKGGRYGQSDDPSVKQFRGAMLYNANTSRPFGVGTVEYPSEGSYNGHQFNPDRDPIGHWVVARGYTNTASRSYFRDSATGVWASALPSFSERTKNFVPRYVDNGISAA